jgi:hypothetical protein
MNEPFDPFADVSGQQIEADSPWAVDPFDSPFSPQFEEPRSNFQSPRRPVNGAALFRNALALNAEKALLKPPVQRQLSSEAKALFNEAMAPPEWLCPITQTLMHDPVVASDGTCYEREAIETWFAHHDTSPLTNLKVETKTLISNTTLKAAMQKEAETDQSLRAALAEETEMFCRFCEQAYTPGEEWAHQSCEEHRASREEKEAQELARLQALYAEDRGASEIAEAVSHAPITAGAVAVAAGTAMTVGSLVGGAAGGISNLAGGSHEIAGAIGDHVRRLRGSTAPRVQLRNTFGEGTHERSLIGGLTRATVGTVAAPLGGAVTATGCAVGTVAAAGFTLGAGNDVKICFHESLHCW